MTPQKVTSSYLFEKDSLKVQLEIEHITGYYRVRPLDGDMFTFKGHSGNDQIDTHKQTTIIDLILTALIFVRKELINLNPIKYDGDTVHIDTVSTIAGTDVDKSEQ